MLGVLVALAIVSGGANIHVRTDGNEGGAQVVNYELITLTHSLFSFHALGHINTIKKVDGAGERNLRGLERWLSVNKWRFIVSEVPALGAAVMAVGLGLKV